MPEQSEQLTKFYQDYLAWLERGAPDGAPFTRRHGLCLNLKTWANTQEKVWYHQLAGEMRDQFRKAELHPWYPFNRGSGDLYEMESNQGECFLNNERIRWVKEHAHI